LVDCVDNVLPFFDTSPEVTAMNTAIDKYYPGLRKNDNIYYEGSALAWPAGLLLEDGVKAGGLGTSEAPSAAEVTRGLTSLHGDTRQGWSPPLTFPANQPHPVNCWFTAHIQDGTSSLVNNGQVTCEK
jgi:branched-chain amino acid transport system substrate-binding protein